MSECFVCVPHSKFFPEESNVRPITERAKPFKTYKGTVCTRNYCLRCSNKRSLAWHKRKRQERAQIIAYMRKCKEG